MTPRWFIGDVTPADISLSRHERRALRQYIATEEAWAHHRSRRNAMEANAGPCPECGAELAHQPYVVNEAPPNSKHQRSARRHEEHA